MGPPRPTHQTRGPRGELKLRGRQDRVATREALRARRAKESGRSENKSVFRRSRSSGSEAYVLCVSGLGRKESRRLVDQGQGVSPAPRESSEKRSERRECVSRDMVDGRESCDPGRSATAVHSR